MFDVVLCFTDGHAATSVAQKDLAFVRAVRSSFIVPDLAFSRLLSWARLNDNTVRSSKRHRTVVRHDAPAERSKTFQRRQGLQRCHRLNQGTVRPSVLVSAAEFWCPCLAPRREVQLT